MSTVEVENIHHRLREELDRLGFSLASAARKAGESSPQRIKDVVSGKQRCPVDLLARLLPLGVDTQYIMTGQHSAATALAPDESILVEGYRKLDGRGKAGLLAFIAGANTPNAARATFHGPVGTAINGDMHIGNFKGKIGG